MSGGRRSGERRSLERVGRRGTESVLYTDRLEDLHAELAGAGHSPGSIVLQPWGHRDFRLTDPDGD